MGVGWGVWGRSRLEEHAYFVDVEWWVVSRAEDSDRVLARVRSELVVGASGKDNERSK